MLPGSITWLFSEPYHVPYGARRVMPPETVDFVSRVKIHFKRTQNHTPISLKQGFRHRFQSLREEFFWTLHRIERRVTYSLDL